MGQKVNFLRNILLSTLFLQNNLLFADGIAIRSVSPITFKGKIYYVQENSQFAVINYENGIEKMMIKMTTMMPERGVYWLLPIPASPEELKMDIAMKLPILRGKELTSWGRDIIKRARMFAYGGQIYPLPFIALYYFLPGGRYTGHSFVHMPGGPSPGAIPPRMVVHEHIEEGGMVAEKITAREPGALYQYLKGKGLNITRGSIPVLDYYIGKDYTFIVAWLAQTSTQSDRAQGLYLKFPTDKIYYPLYPTSVYGDESISVDIYLIGFRQPTAESVKSLGINPEYCLGNLQFHNSLPADFFQGDRENVKFTNIYFEKEARSFASDLWISPHPPFKALYSYFFVRYHIFILLCIYIVSSLLSALLIGRMVYPKWDHRALLEVGLLNLFTLFPVIFGAIYLPRSEGKKEPEALNELAKKGYLYGRFDSIILFFLSAFFFLLAINTPDEPSYPATAFAVLFTLIVAFLLTRVKKEDQPLFSQLIEAGYSPYLFVPAGVGKALFIIFFSLAFILAFTILTSFLQLPLLPS